MNDEQPATPQPAAPVAWRHNLTHCLYETAEEVQLADADSWAEPLYLVPPSTAPSVRVCCQDFEKCRELCVPRADYWQGQTSQLCRELAATPQQPAAASAGASDKLTTCNCRWDGEKLVRQCTMHEAWRDAITDWAERAKAAERKLEIRAALQSPPVATAQQSETQPPIRTGGLLNIPDVMRRAASAGTSRAPFPTGAAVIHPGMTGAGSISSCGCYSMTDGFGNVAEFKCEAHAFPTHPAAGEATERGAARVPAVATPAMIEAFAGQLEGSCGSFFDWERGGDEAYAAMLAAADAATR